MFEVEDVPKPDVPKVYLQVHRHEETQPRLSDLCGASRKRETKAPSPLLSVAAGTMNSNTSSRSRRRHAGYFPQGLRAVSRARYWAERPDITMRLRRDIPIFLTECES